MNDYDEPERPDVEEALTFREYVWYIMKLAAWHLWPHTGCIYCFFYRGVLLGAGIALLLGSLTWLLTTR